MLSGLYRYSSKKRVENLKVLKMNTFVNVLVTSLKSSLECNEYSQEGVQQTAS